MSQLLALHPADQLTEHGDGDTVLYAEWGVEAHDRQAEFSHRSASDVAVGHSALKASVELAGCRYETLDEIGAQIDSLCKQLTEGERNNLTNYAKLLSEAYSSHKNGEEEDSLWAMNKASEVFKAMSPDTQKLAHSDEYTQLKDRLSYAKRKIEQ